MLVNVLGFIMTRICNRNKYPHNVDIQDTIFKLRYSVHKDHIVKTMKYIAEVVRDILAQLGKY